MIRSMTGFGRAQDTVDGVTVTVEIKSVNHRYFDFSCRVPRNYGFLEEKLKSFVQSRVTRGKIECYVQIEAQEVEECIVKVNHSLAKGYIDALNEIGEVYGLENDINVSAVARNHDIFSVHKSDAEEEVIWKAVSVVANIASDSFVSMREREGEKLKADILSRCDLILEKVSFIEERSPQTVTEYNAKLLERMQSVLGDVQVDEQRLLTEAAIYADKIAVAEETVRLRSHISQLCALLGENGSVGKKLDFIVQEMNRETNTIGSKANDLKITNFVIENKNEIEKIREQIQNIE